MSSKSQLKTALILTGGAIKDGALKVGEGVADGYSLVVGGVGAHLAQTTVRAVRVKNRMAEKRLERAKARADQRVERLAEELEHQLQLL